MQFTQWLNTSLGHTEDTAMLEPAYNEKRAFDTFLITIIMLQMRIYSDADCRSQNCFSENEHFLHQLA